MNTKQDTGEAPDFIKELLELHEKYRALVSCNKATVRAVETDAETKIVDQFSGDALFQKALKTAIETTVNENVGKHKTAELLSR